MITMTCKIWQFGNFFLFETKKSRTTKENRIDYKSTCKLTVSRLVKLGHPLQILLVFLCLYFCLRVSECIMLCVESNTVRACYGI